MGVTRCFFSETGAMRRSRLQHCPPPQFRFGEANPRLPYGSWQERGEIHINDTGRKKKMMYRCPQEIV